MSASIPAQQLAALIDRMGARDGDPHHVYRALNVDESLVRRWRQEPCKVSANRADRVLTATPFLWFDVWPACETHDPCPTCRACVAHVRARRAFTGQPIPVGFTGRR